jgi:S1-C subfamily serine protease
MTDLCLIRFKQMPALGCKLFLLFFLILSAAFSQAQEKVFFDKVGKSTDESTAYYYRQKTSEPDSYKSYYINGGSLYFEGRILTPSNTDENVNLYTETCTWYYKNGNKKAQRTFDKAGLESGTSTYYYETGKLWKQFEFVNGKSKPTFSEYDEDGKTSRIFEEDFNDNSNDWDLYSSDKTSASLRFGQLQLASFTDAGASRYISHPLESQDFAIELVMNLIKLKDGEKAGLIFGFKDWQNYSYFLISSNAYFIGNVYEGISSIKADGLFSGDIVKGGFNNLKIISNGEKNFYSINGSIQRSDSRFRTSGSNIGFAVSGKSTIEIDKLIIKEIDYKSDAGVSGKRTEADMDVKATGSGLIISSSGYVLTNFHVVKGANKIIVQLTSGGVVKSYTAVLVQKDMDNDLVILKIKDESFSPLAPIKYSFKESGGVEVGATVFTIGYPYALSGMGTEAKFTDGKISSKTGYNDAINSYQASVPVQPGNSGGPLFTDKGELVGVVNSKIQGAENVTYAIKLSYVKNLMELLPETVELPKDQTIATLTLEEKVKVLSSYVTLIKIK